MNRLRNLTVVITIAAMVGLTGCSSATEPEPEPATDAGLTGLYAQAACDMAGEDEFPYGWNPHWIMGKLAEEVQADEIYFKVEATVTNAFDAEQDVNVECYVTGTNDAPEVTDLIAY